MKDKKQYNRKEKGEVKRKEEKREKGITESKRQRGTTEYGNETRESAGKDHQKEGQHNDEHVKER